VRPRRREAWEGYAFAAPWIGGFLMLTAGPMLFSIWLSFHRWNVLQPAHYVGAFNYVYAAHDQRFWTALRNTAAYALVGVPLGQVVALGLAVLLNQQVRGQGFFRTVFYLPSVIAGVATAMVWTLLLHPDAGAVNLVLRGLHLPEKSMPGWFTSPSWWPPGAMPGLILMSVWGTGAAMIIYLAGLQNVPQDLVEAAEIDGATAPQRFRHLTIPMLTPTIFFNVVMGIIGSFQVFTSSYVVSNGTGGPADATLTYVLYLYKHAFEQFHMGYAAALAWIMFAILMSITLLVFKSSGRWVYYEGVQRR
jgi:multiple sugar transport system permease protein